MRMKLAFMLICVAVAAAMEERLFEFDDQEESVEKRDAVSKGDILSTFCCRYLKAHGFLASNPKLKNLCLTTFQCNDVFSNKSCHIAKAKNECAKNSKLSLTYCRYTCNKCADLHHCNKALGMQSKAIPDSKITASSHYAGNLYFPYYARLHSNKRGWAPKHKRLGEWIQVDLSSVTTVTAIATQGANGPNEWTKSYSLQYSSDGSAFKNYQAGKIFAGNKDQKTVVKHVLNPPISARFIRVLPKTWAAQWIAIRMELYGCK